MPYDIIEVVLRALVIYVVGLMVIRIGKSRLMSHSTPLDLLLALLLGTILGQGISGTLSISGSLAATATVVGIHWLLSWLAFHSHTFGDLVKGHSYPLVSKGEIQWQNMRRSLTTRHDLDEAMRVNGNIGEIDRVEHAYKERNGIVSVVPRESTPRVVDVAVDAGVQIVRIEFTNSK